MTNSSEISNEFNLEKWLKFLNKLKPVNHELDVVFSCLMGLIFSASVIGNSLTCFVILYNKSMHTTTNCYLFNLAVSDLILTFSMLLEIIDLYGPTADSLIVCRLSWFLVTFLWNNGILTMSALAIERFVAICYPFLIETSKTCRRVAKIIGVVWMVAAVETVIDIMTVGLIKTGQTPICFLIPTPTARLMLGVLAIIAFVIPFIIMVFAYSMIAYRVNNSWVENSRDQIFNQVDNRSKTNKLVIAITVSFISCWMPFFVAKMLICVLEVDQLLQLSLNWSNWYYIVIVSSWMNVALNPILYNVMSKKFRAASKTLWNAVMRRSLFWRNPGI